MKFIRFVITIDPNYVSVPSMFTKSRDSGCVPFNIGKLDRDMGLICLFAMFSKSNANKTNLNCLQCCACLNCLQYLSDVLLLSDLSIYKSEKQYSNFNNKWTCSIDLI